MQTHQIVGVMGEILAEQWAAADCLQPPLRFGFQQRLSPNVRLHRKEGEWHEIDLRRRPCGTAPSGPSLHSS